MALLHKGQSYSQDMPARRHSFLSGVCALLGERVPPAVGLFSAPPAPLILREPLKTVLWRACPHSFQLLYCSASAPVSIDRSLGLTNTLK